MYPQFPEDLCLYLHIKFVFVKLYTRLVNEVHFLDLKVYFIPRKTNPMQCMHSEQRMVGLHKYFQVVGLMPISMQDILLLLPDWEGHAAF